MLDLILSDNKKQLLIFNISLTDFFLLQIELKKASMSPCSIPPKIPHGYNKYSSSLHGSKALYQCFNGFELSTGDGKLKCVDGEWVGPTPVCTRVNCAYPGPLHNGKIFYIGTMSEYTYQPYMNSVGQNKKIRYECDKGIIHISNNKNDCYCT